MIIDDNEGTSDKCRLARDEYYIINDVAKVGELIIGERSELRGQRPTCRS
jgi:hypothetical protein